MKSDDTVMVKLDDKVKLDRETLVVLETFFNKWFNQFDRKLDLFGVEMGRIKELLVKIEENTNNGFELVQEGKNVKYKLNSSFVRKNV